MRSEYRPVRTEEAKRRLASYLKEAERKLEEEKEHYKEMRRRRSLWSRVIALFR